MTVPTAAQARTAAAEARAIGMGTKNDHPADALVAAADLIDRLASRLEQAEQALREAAHARELLGSALWLHSVGGSLSETDVQTAHDVLAGLAGGDQ